jgi:ZIP family zinc transporter
LIYISAAHLLPEAREYEKRHSTRGFLLWIVIALHFVLTKLF